MSIFVITANKQIRNSCAGQSWLTRVVRWCAETVSSLRTPSGQVLWQQDREEIVRVEKGGRRQCRCWHDILFVHCLVLLLGTHSIRQITIKSVLLIAKCGGSYLILSHPSLFRHVILCPDVSRLCLDPAEFNFSSHLAFKCV